MVQFLFRLNLRCGRWFRLRNSGSLLCSDAPRRAARSPAGVAGPLRVDDPRMLVGAIGVETVEIAVFVGCPSDTAAAQPIATRALDLRRPGVLV